jgi:hypothetical protein
MHHEIEINTYLPLDAGSATLIEDVPVKLTIRGENDGCNELHWWIEEIEAEFVGADLKSGYSPLIAKNGYGLGNMEIMVLRQLYAKAEKDPSIEADVIEQLYPLVFGRDAA